MARTVPTDFEFPDPKMVHATHVRYGVVALATVMSFLLYLDRFCLSIVERYIQVDLQLSNTQVSLLMGAFFLTYALAQVPSGWLSDRYGARLMLSLYILLWSLFTGLMGALAVLAGLVALRLLCGLAQAGAYPTSGSILSKWAAFRERGRFSSTIALGGRVGGSLAPVLTAYLMLAFLPRTAVVSATDVLDRSELRDAWRPVMFVYGAAGVLVAAAFWLCYRDRPRSHPRCNSAEIAIIESGRPASATTPHGKVGGMPVYYLLKSRSLWCSSISQFGTNIGWVFLLTWMPRYLVEVHDVSLEARSWMTAVPTTVGIAGMFTGGWLTDRLVRGIGLRWGRGFPMSLTRFAAMAAYLACLGLHSPWAIVAVLAIVSFSVDLGTPALWAFMQDVGGRQVGSVLGWGNMWGNIGAAVSPLALNALAEAHGWHAVFLACAAAFLVSGIAALGVDATIPIAPPEEE
ncbi:MAG TPA: MFS transporter [Gemmataceae bacterium]|nr:MFS transporter [Gemmataceae bacterium]